MKGRRQVGVGRVAGASDVWIWSGLTTLTNRHSRPASDCHTARAQALAIWAKVFGAQLVGK